MRNSPKCWKTWWKEPSVSGTPWMKPSYEPPTLNTTYSGPATSGDCSKASLLYCSYVVPPHEPTLGGRCVFPVAQRNYTHLSRPPNQLRTPWNLAQIYSTCIWYRISCLFATGTTGWLLHTRSRQPLCLWIYGVSQTKHLYLRIFHWLQKCS